MVRIEAIWYMDFTTLVVHSTQGMVVPCIAAYRICCFLEQCMSRPYPIGEKVAGHKLANLYTFIIIIMLAGCTKADFIVRTGKLGTAANACALQDGLSKDPRRRVSL